MFRHFPRALSATAVAAVLSVSAPDASGQSQVTFTASLQAAPCKVSPLSQNQTVDLGTMDVGALSQAGMTLGNRRFDLTLIECQPGTRVRLRFNGQSAASAGAGANILKNLVETADGGAGNVGIRLRGPDGSPLALGTDALQDTVDGNSITWPVGAEVYALGPASSGRLNAQMQVTYIYN